MQEGAKKAMDDLKSLKLKLREQEINRIQRLEKRRTEIMKKFEEK